MRPARALSAAIVCLMCGCANLTVMSHVPLSTMSRLSSMTLAEVEPSELRVAARLPEGLEPRPGGVKVRIDLAGGAIARAPIELVLESAAEPAEVAALAKHRKPGQRLFVYRLSQKDIERVRGVTAEMGIARGVSISAGVEACYRKPLGVAPLPTTTFLKTNSGSYFVLTEDLDLRRVVAAKDLAIRVPPCG